jgi:hypothetical protein
MTLLLRQKTLDPPLTSPVNSHLIDFLYGDAQLAFVVTVTATEPASCIRTSEYKGTGGQRVQCSNGFVID